jgi:hypothetical protein
MSIGATQHGAYIDDQRQSMRDREVAKRLINFV